MKSKRVVTVSNDDLSWECKLEFTMPYVTINGKEHQTTDMLKESIEFFMSGDEVLDRHDDVLHAYSELVASTIIRESFKGMSKFEIIRQFDTIEGLCSLDGSEGIALLEVEFDDSVFDELSVSEE